MATPIRHTDCGEIVMWYLAGPETTICSSASIVYLDGRRPEYGSAIPFCPHCGGVMTPGVTLVRCFDEDIDPGFDIQDAWRNRERVSLPPGPPDPMVAMLTHNRDTARWIFGAMAVFFLATVALGILEIFR